MLTFFSSAQFALDSQTLVWMRSGGIILLISVLIFRELAANAEGDWRRLVRFLNVAVLPLLVLFVATIISITISFLAQKPH